MSGSRTIPPLRHPQLGCLLPWLDTRPVPLSTLAQYLGCDYARIDTLAREGVFSHPGCTVTIHGESRSLTYYVPSRVWSANHWMPDRVVLEVLAIGAAAPAVRSAAQHAQDLASQLAAIATATPPAPSPAGPRLVEPKHA